MLKRLTRQSSAAPSESAAGYLWKYFNHVKGRKQAGLGVGWSALLGFMVRLFHKNNKIRLTGRPFFDHIPTECDWPQDVRIAPGA
jgi:hypothetical protein